MKKRTFLISLTLVFVAEMIALIVSAIYDIDNAQDAVLVNEVVQSVQKDWNTMENHKNQTSLDYVVINTDGDIIFKTKSGLSETVNMAVIHRDTILDVEVENVVVGKIIIYSDSVQMLQIKKQKVVIVLSVAMLMQCGICMGYIIYLNRTVIRPFHKLKGFAERIYNEASRLITLVEDIIKLSKLDEGEIEIEKEDVDLYDLTRRIVSRLAPQAEKRAVHVEVTGENVICHGVRQILDEMIYNICENAIKYNRRGGSVSVWVGATLKGKKIIVTDTGIGIPEDQQERIFERFYRVDKSHSKETGGTGLGLSIVKHGAMLHNAQIHVESKVGKGTKMELTF